MNVFIALKGTQFLNFISRYEAQMINIERAGTSQHKRSNEPHREITNEMAPAQSD